MIINGQSLLKAAPIHNMFTTKMKHRGYSFGLSEAGYDIRIADSIQLSHRSRFQLAYAMDQFQMPDNLVGVVHDKSTWARQGLSVFNTVIEPGWEGYLTLELVYHGSKILDIPSGVGIAQVIFHETKESAQYTGKYQNQEAGPQEARLK